MCIWFFFFALHYQVPEKREKAKVITLFQGVCITHKGVIYADGWKLGGNMHIIKMKNSVQRAKKMFLKIKELFYYVWVWIVWIYFSRLIMNSQLFFAYFGSALCTYREGNWQHGCKCGSVKILNRKFVWERLCFKNLNKMKGVA